jgi:hypothetical protein
MLVLYRAMLEENGLPKLGSSATRLGVRRDKDIAVDANGMVHAPSPGSDRLNGMSASTEMRFLPYFAMPQKVGGGHPKTEIWAIAEDQLGPDLAAVNDRPHHISVGPKRTMLFEDYVRAIELTVGTWVKVS